MKSIAMRLLRSMLTSEFKRASMQRANGTPPPNLTSEASAILRNQLLAELDKLGKDDLDAWTLQAWPKANTLTPADGEGQGGVSGAARPSTDDTA
jgi:hypothetical protein